MHRRASKRQTQITLALRARTQTAAEPAARDVRIAPRPVKPWELPQDATIGASRGPSLPIDRVCVEPYALAESVCVIRARAKRASVVCVSLLEPRCSASLRATHQLVSTYFSSLPPSSEPASATDTQPPSSSN